jgi:hypothetical protein
MRGDPLRVGWRVAVGVLLVTVLLVHGFDGNFAVDGYTVTILGLLVVLALAGELDSAKLPGLDVRFRRKALSEIEEGMGDPPSATAPAEGTADGPPEELKEPPPEEAEAELRSLAQEDPTAAVIAFFVDVERDVSRLYSALMGKTAAPPTLRRQVDALAQYGVIDASEARVILELARLRNSYVHGSPVSASEAATVLAIGARILPSLNRARWSLGRAFERRVEEILDRLPGITYERQPAVEVPGGVRRPDFLITEPRRILIEAKLGGGVNLAKRLLGADQLAGLPGVEDAVVVLPGMSAEELHRLQKRTSLTVLSIDRLESWLRLRFDQR